MDDETDRWIDGWKASWKTTTTSFTICNGMAIVWPTPWFVKKEPFDWLTTKYFRETKCYWECLREQIGNLGGTLWELNGNILGAHWEQTEIKNPLPRPSHWLHEISRNCLGKWALPYYVRKWDHSRCQSRGVRASLSPRLSFLIVKP
jgi:hypothetical protein